MKLTKGPLKKDELMTEDISEALLLELKGYHTFDYDTWVEGWKVDSLAFRYFNIL